MSNTLMNTITEVKKAIYGTEYNTNTEAKFNFAIINKTENGLTYEELWILANAYYDYNVKRFVKIDPDNTSFAIQIQANGTYPGEAELGYTTNTGINIWRNPRKSDVEATFPNHATDESYDFTDFMGNNSYIGVRRKSDNVWQEFGVYAGWNNNFMNDSYGGLTIGGAGFEIDGNGIFPFTRVTSSAFTGTDNHYYYLLGLLDNAYHPTLWGWDSDKNDTGCWFFGLKTPSKIENGNDVYLMKNNEEAKFVVMYNDTPFNDENIHELDISRWQTIFEANLNSVKGLVNGQLTTLTGEPEDTGWKNLTLTGNFIDYDANYKVQYRKVGKTVQIQGITSLNANLTAPTELTIGTLPTGYRPSKNLFNVCDIINSPDLWTCTIKTNGEITFSKVIRGDTIVPGDAYAPLRLNTMFLI